MDAPCKIQRSIHVFRLVNNMCPGKWVHIRGAFPVLTLVISDLQTRLHDGFLHDLLMLH